MLIDETSDQVIPRAGYHRVGDLRIGLGYVAAQLDDGRCGVAYTFRDEVHESCCVFREAGTISGRLASELVGWAKASDPVAAAVGLATMNALIEPPAEAVECDLLASLSLAQDDDVGMVGYFGPLVEPLRSRARNLYIFERGQEDQAGVLLESATKMLLPLCQVVILSATTLLNRTIDGLLDLCHIAREVAVLGPSTPLLPEVFRPRGVTLLCGVQVTDSARVLRVVAEGGGSPQLRAGIRKLTIRIPR
jgi:uncharacterized protein (DUF4213/DUF364 family)